MRTTVLPFPLPALAVCLILAASVAHADPNFGVRAGVNLDREDPLVGAELITRLEGRWFVNPNLEVTFGDFVDVIGLNADFHYDFETSGSAYFWVGPGLAVLFADYDGRGSDTDVGVNLLAGLGFPTSSGVVPYFQGKATVADETDGSLAFGVRF
ncbi:MAG TPA: hypothetical protein VKU85_06140 [bacterium]|nr:hypothetical protein [bacterium]